MKKAAVIGFFWEYLIGLWLGWGLIFRMLGNVKTLTSDHQVFVFCLIAVLLLLAGTANWVIQGKSGRYSVHLRGSAALFLMVLVAFTLLGYVSAGSWFLGLGGFLAFLVNTTTPIWREWQTVKPQTK